MAWRQQLGCQCAACRFVQKALVFAMSELEFEMVTVFEADLDLDEVEFYSVMDARATARPEIHTEKWQ